MAMKTDWGEVANWYNDVVYDKDSYQVNVILPNLKRMLGDISAKKVLDIACGNGFFSEALYKMGAKVTGIDLGEDLLDIARSNNKNINYILADASNFNFKDKDFDIIICVLAIQNIKDYNKAIANAVAHLKKGGEFILIINHPSFRIPKSSDWGFNKTRDAQYRIIYSYMTESNIKMDMNPGEKNVYKKIYTYSFHRPLQSYIKSLTKAGVNINSLEEWISHKKSARGPKQQAEDKARHEFPMFMCIKSVKN